MSGKIGAWILAIIFAVGVSHNTIKGSDEAVQGDADKKSKIEAVDKSVNKEPREIVIKVKESVSKGDAEIEEAINYGDPVIAIKSAASKGKKLLKPFPHKKHQEKFVCVKCHHGMGVDGGQICPKHSEIQKCDTCHNGVIKNKKVDTPKKAFHANCKDCHKAQTKKEGSKVKGSCKECHTKKKRAKNIEGC